MTGTLRIALVALALLASQGAAQTAPEITGRVEWGIWIDPDGCMHWWADGGFEGYMLDRIDPKTGRAVCLARQVCLSEPMEALFAPGTGDLTPEGAARLEEFFAGSTAYGHDILAAGGKARGAPAIDLAQNRTGAVAALAISLGAVVDRRGGTGEGRIEVICTQ